MPQAHPNWWPRNCQARQDPPSHQEAPLLGRLSQGCGCHVAHRGRPRQASQEVQPWVRPSLASLAEEASPGSIPRRGGLGPPGRGPERAWACHPRTSEDRGAGLTVSLGTQPLPDSAPSHGVGEQPGPGPIPGPWGRGEAPGGPSSTPCPPPVLTAQRLPANQPPGTGLVSPLASTSQKPPASS